MNFLSIVNPSLDNNYQIQIKILQYFITFFLRIKGLMNRTCSKWMEASGVSTDYRVLVEATDYRVQTTELRL